MTTAIITLAILAAGYLAGRLHGKAAHHRFLTRGFRLMAAAAERDGVHLRGVHELVVRPIDVSNAFGKQDDIDWQIHLFEPIPDESKSSATEEGAHHVQEADDDADQDEQGQDLGRADLAGHDSTVGVEGVTS